jgi:hypothetical protein
MATTLVDHSIIFVTVHQVDNGPHPRPLDCGFSINTEYAVLGCGDYSETSEAYFVLVNDRREFWWISNRHVRYSRMEAI